MIQQLMGLNFLQEIFHIVSFCLFFLPFYLTMQFTVNKNCQRLNPKPRISGVRSDHSISCATTTLNLIMVHHITCATEKLAIILILIKTANLFNKTQSVPQISRQNHTTNGPWWWWSSGHRTYLLLQQSQFDSF